MPFHCFTEGEGGEKGTSLLKGIVDNPCVIPTHWFAMRKHFPCKISAGKVRIAASIVVVICLFGALDFCVYAPKVRPIKCLFRIFIEGNVDISNNQSTKLLVVESPTWHDPWANDGRHIAWPSTTANKFTTLALIYLHEWLWFIVYYFHLNLLFFLYYLYFVT